MKAPVYTSLLIAVAAVCLLGASVMARGQALAAHPTTLEFHVSGGEDGKLPACTFASGLIAGSLFSFSHSAQGRDRRAAGAICREIRGRPGFSEDEPRIIATRADAAPAKVAGFRLSCGLDDGLREMISARATSPEDNLAARGLLALE